MNNILTKWEKKYLKSFVEPFEGDVEFIKKINSNSKITYIKKDTTYQRLAIVYFDIVTEDIKTLYLPPFESDTIFKDMKINQAYSLKELKLRGKGAIEWCINHINM